MIVSHKHNFIFVSNPKTGTTSIEKALESHNDAPELNVGFTGLWANKHMPPSVVKGMLSTEDWDRYFKFGFVRHPESWFLSAYAFSERLFMRCPFSVDPRRWPMVVHNLHTRRKHYRKTKLDEGDVDFLWNLTKQFRAIPSMPSMLQSTYFFDLDGKKLIDFIGRFENLHQDVDLLAKKLRLPIDLPHLNRTTNRGTAAPRFSLSGSAHARIRQLYKADFENFNYD